METQLQWDCSVCNIQTRSRTSSFVENKFMIVENKFMIVENKFMIVKNKFMIVENKILHFYPEETFRCTYVRFDVSYRVVDFLQKRNERFSSHCQC